MMDASRIETKRAALTIAKVDEQGIFEGYASLFNIVDLGGDIVMPGAFARTLKSVGASGVKMLWQHDGKQPIGAWTSLIEDGRGLKAGRAGWAVDRLPASARDARQGEWTPENSRA
jgi:uncharacterized protein